MLRSNGWRPVLGVSSGLAAMGHVPQPSASRRGVLGRRARFCCWTRSCLLGTAARDLIRQDCAKRLLDAEAKSDEL